MADIVSQDVRSRIMSSIRGKDTAPELVVRKLLHRDGFRYRLHVSSLPGKPDLVFSAYKAVVFIHGCFWHAHDCEAFRLPRTNRRFWKQKLLGNRQRDRLAIELLEVQGWRVLVIWECALRGPRQLKSKIMLKRIADWLRLGRKSMEIKAG
jgi:DNA mismatch endonuclease (patch repair protein)